MPKTMSGGETGSVACTMHDKTVRLNASLHISLKFSMAEGDVLWAKLSASLAERRCGRANAGRNRSDGDQARSKMKDRYSSQQAFNDPDLTNCQIYIEFRLTIEELRQTP